MTDDALPAERADLLHALAMHRRLFLQTVDGLTDEQAALTPTVSELCLGGLVKHVNRMWERWLAFLAEGPSAMAMTEDSFRLHAESFRMLDGETLAGLVATFEATAARVDELVRTLPSLDADQPLPEAPWFPPGARWSARRVVIHLIAEMTQHAGHADIIREAIDGQKTMG